MFKFRLSEKSRKFAKDVGGIVLGVLIALGIGEIADTARKHLNARLAFDAVRADMLDNYQMFEVTTLMAPCIERRLAAVTDELEHARRTGRLRDIGDIGSGASSTFRTGAWERAVANGDTLYMSDDRVAELTDYHELLRFYSAHMEEGNLDWARLTVLSGTPGEIDENTLANARQTVAELQYRMSALAGEAELLMQVHGGLGLPAHYSAFNGVSRDREQWRRLVNDSQICQPLEVA